MVAKIHYLHGEPSPIAHLVRVGYSGYRQLETLSEQGRFEPRQLVIEAGNYEAQRDLVSSVWSAGAEIVLDPTIAELSVIGRYSGACRDLPWANRERPLGPDDLRGDAGKTVARQIADFSVSRKVDVVLAPTHLLTGARDEWLALDRRICEELRIALDSQGGRQIEIDYPLIITYEMLRDEASRRALVQALGELPFVNLWVRVAGFGADASAVGVRRFIMALSEFHLLGKPVIADCVGGLAALAVVSFGAASGVAHGIAEKERFDASKWNMVPKKGGGGQSGRLYLPGLDRHFKLREARSIIEARGGRRLLACSDRDCCPLGLEDMEKDPKAHFLTQRTKQVRDIERVVDFRRSTQFLDFHLASADRTARQAAKLKVEPALGKALRRASARLDRMRGVLEDLERTAGREASRAQPITLPAAVQARRAN